MSRELALELSRIMCHALLAAPMPIGGVFKNSFRIRWRVFNFLLTWAGRESGSSKIDPQCEVGVQKSASGMRSGVQKLTPDMRRRFTNLVRELKIEH